MAHFLPDYAVGPAPRRKRLLLAALVTAVIVAAFVLIGWLAFSNLSPAVPRAASWQTSTQKITLEGDIPVTLSSPELLKAPLNLPRAPAEIRASTVTYENTTAGPIWVSGADANVVVSRPGRAGPATTAGPSPPLSCCAAWARIGTPSPPASRTPSRSTGRPTTWAARRG